MKCDICKKEDELMPIYLKLEQNANYFSPEPFPDSKLFHLCKACRQRLVDSFSGSLSLLGHREGM